MTRESEEFFEQIKAQADVVEVPVELFTPFIDKSKKTSIYFFGTFIIVASLVSTFFLWGPNMKEPQLAMLGLFISLIIGMIVFMVRVQKSSKEAFVAYIKEKDMKAGEMIEERYSLRKASRYESKVLLVLKEGYRK